MAEPLPELEIDRLPPVIDSPAEVTDTLHLVGEPMFSGSTMQSQLEADIADQARSVYWRLPAASSRVSALQVRRALGPMKQPVLPRLDPDLYLLPIEAGQTPLHAVLTLPIEGDPRLLEAGLPAPLPGRLPVGVVEHGDLILEVAFTPENAAFVPLLLQSELDLVAAYLKRQAQASAKIASDYPATVKAVVTEQWPRLKSARRTG